MRHIIYVDGAVNVGKSTFIEILKNTFESVLKLTGKNKRTAHHYNVEVLPEPLHREWTKGIVQELHYPDLLHFLLIRKSVAIESWSRKIASDGLQELENNILIVERSPGGDRRVSQGFTEFYPDLNVKYSGEVVHHIFIKNLNKESEEQNRLNVLYNDMEIELGTERVYRFNRPELISSYHITAAIIVRKMLGI